MAPLFAQRWFVQRFVLVPPFFCQIMFHRNRTEDSELSLATLEYRPRFAPEPRRKLGLRLQKLLKKSGKRVDKELTSILKRFAEILVHGERVSDEYFECS